MSDTLDPESISKRLGLNPSRSWKKGDLIGTSKGKGASETGTWSLYSDAVPSEDVTEHLQWLIDQIKPVVAVIKSLLDEGYWIDLCCIVSTEKLLSFILPQTLLSDIAETGLELDFTIDLRLNG